MKKYFGTDGIRGKVGEWPITPDFMLKLGWAIGRVLNNGKSHRVVIGKDTRISGYMFESVLEAGLSAAGVDILLLGPMPTPAIAYLTRTFHAQAGIVISASHNPYYDNGIKFFSPEGKKLSDEVELAIEAELDKPLVTVPSNQLGKAKRVDDAGGRYIEYCKNTLRQGLDLKGLKIVLDCANGATYHVAPAVFRELGADVIELGVKPNGLNINADTGSMHPEILQQEVLAQQAHVGIALDGDGDRVLMVDGHGELVDGDELIFILAKFLKPQGVVGTLMSNLGMELALKKNHIEFVRVKVGDRYVIEALEKNEWSLGGESSGHIICRNVSTTGDGIISALQVLAAILVSGKSLYELKHGMQKFPQHMINVKLNSAVKLENYPAITSAVAAVEKQLAQKGRVLLRASGTEPVIRVMVEGIDPNLVKQLAERLAQQVSDIVSCEL